MTGRQKMIVGWACLLLVPVLLVAALFAVMEAYALMQPGPEDAITLSRFVWELNQAWPVFLPLTCYLAGGIQWGFLVHILWRWSPEDPSDRRG
jgi:hypothetical protein